MAKGLDNPVKSVFDKYAIRITNKADIKNLPQAIKFDLVIEWMRYENKRGLGVVYSHPQRGDVCFMDIPIVPSFHVLIDLFNEWAIIQELTKLRNDLSYVHAKSLIFIKALIRFGERLAFIYFIQTHRRERRKAAKIQ